MKPISYQVIIALWVASSTFALPVPLPSSPNNPNPTPATNPPPPAYGTPGINPLAVIQHFPPGFGDLQAGPIGGAAPPPSNQQASAQNPSPAASSGYSGSVQEQVVLPSYSNTPSHAPSYHSNTALPGAIPPSPPQPGHPSGAASDRGISRIITKTNETYQKGKAKVKDKARKLFGKKDQGGPGPSTGGAGGTTA
jgi:hypothetical protein